MRWFKGNIPQKKIPWKHPDITIENMLKIQEAVDDEMVIRPEENPFKLEFFLEIDEAL